MKELSNITFLFRLWKIYRLKFFEYVLPFVRSFQNDETAIPAIDCTEKAAFYLSETISNKERIDILNATLKIISSNPLGVGPDNLKYYLGDYNLLVKHAENNYLHILAENGIVGFLGFMIFIFYPIIINTKRIKFGLYNSENVGSLLISIYLSISYLFNVETYSMYIWIIHSIIWCNISLKNNL